MNYIKERYIVEEEIKKSRFIGVIIPLKEKEEYREYIKQLKNEYPKANHYCYGYIYDEVKKSNDDGEPSSTAGKPILEVLIKRNLNHVLAVVIRYFGGIKLGAGGLTRAYVQLTAKAVDASIIYHEEKLYHYLIEGSYSLNDQVKYYLEKQQIEISNIIYQENVLYDVFSKERLDNLNGYFQNKLTIKCLGEEFSLQKGEKND